MDCESGAARWGRDKGIRPQKELGYQPFPRQREFHQSPARYRLFGGAAGPGKTKALLMEAILQADENPGANTLLLRRTFPELEASLLQYFRRDIPRELYRSYNDAKHVVTWWNNSTTRFGHCHAESDVYQYQGAEFQFIGIDELTHFTLRQWQFLTSRNRCPNPGAFPCMAGATNPGNLGHAWVKALWIDRIPAPGMEGELEYDAADYEFIPARISDNPIYATDENYLKKLRALPKHLRQAMLDGDWSVFAGQYFDNFDPGKHVRRAEQLRMEAWQPKWISIDWGFEHPAAVYWHTRLPAEGGAAGTREGRDEKHRVATYRELVKNHLAPRQLAKEIIELSRDARGEIEKPQAIYLSPDAFAKRTADASIADQINEEFGRWGFPQAQPADNERVGGWMLMYQMLEQEEWEIADSCCELIQLLPNLTRDRAHVEDIQKREGDDAADAARYGLASHLRHRSAKPPLEMRMAEKVSATDATVRAIQARRAIMEEKEKSRPVRFGGRRRNLPD